MNTKRGILVKYGEIVLKGNNRAKFENVLVSNIKTALRPVGEVTVKKEQGRLFIFKEEETDADWIDEACERLSKVFGILRICPVDLLENIEIDAIGQAAVEYIRREFGSTKHTFKVICKRANKHYPMQSMEVAAKVGEYILGHDTDWTVDVHNPEVLLYVELRTENYLYGKEIDGPGGLPVGTGGKATLLLSGGIDSPVAGYMMARRGLSMSAVYFHAHPYTSERAKEKVLELAHRVSLYAGCIPVYVVPFTEIQLAIYEKCHHEKLTIIMRRIMYMVAERLAAKEEAVALVTGENMGQVASQTLASLICTNDAATLPVFRPLIAFDKQEIIEIAKKIDTFETSILPYEDCCTIFVAKHPETQPKLEEIKRSEQNLTDLEEMITRAVDGSELYLCKPEGIKKVF